MIRKLLCEFWSGSGSWHPQTQLVWDLHSARHLSKSVRPLVGAVRQTCLLSLLRCEAAPPTFLLNYQPQPLGRHSHRERVRRLTGCLYTPCLPRTAAPSPYVGFSKRSLIFIRGITEYCSALAYGDAGDGTGDFRQASAGCHVLLNGIAAGEKRCLSSTRAQSRWGSSSAGAACQLPTAPSTNWAETLPNNTVPESFPAISGG